MIHYHGTPITPETACYASINCGHAFISFRHRNNEGIILECSQSFACDNGAFSAWRSGNPIIDWAEYYSWIKDISRHPGFDFAVIPDVIEGDEPANNSLIQEWLDVFGSKSESIGAPVWHLHESIDRLCLLASQWPRVCFGSSGEYAVVGSDQWWERMGDALDAIVDSDGFPITKLHGLRMLDYNIFPLIPFSSADSTNIARNIGIDKRWRGSYAPPTKDARAMALRNRIESRNSASKWIRQPKNINLWWGNNA